MDGVKVATPLLLVLICIELSDVVFAVDSVPAVFGVTKVRGEQRGYIGSVGWLTVFHAYHHILSPPTTTQDPFIVYTSNIFAIIGLRSLYTILAEAVEDLPYLKPAVAIILGLVGGKLGLEYFGYEVSNAISLGTIVTILGAGITASIASKKEPNPDQD